MLQRVTSWYELQNEPLTSGDEKNPPSGTNDPIKLLTYHGDATVRDKRSDVKSDNKPSKRQMLQPQCKNAVTVAIAITERRYGNISDAVFVTPEYRSKPQAIPCEL